MDQARDGSDRDIQLALASLQLPHLHSGTTGSSRPRKSRDKPSSNVPQQAGFQTIPVKERRSRPEESSPPPTVTILVCADIDLKSASALAEYTIQQQQLFTQQKQRNRNQHHHYHFDSSYRSRKEAGFDATAIDLIIAAGPCSRDEDLFSYYRGKQKHYNARSSVSHFQSNAAGRISDNLAPFLRSPEKTSALEGLMTAALSQLENIVCRVVYCPGFSDPLSIMVPSTLTGMYDEITYKRLTPNSRNIHQQWLPLAPGLGCAALFYFDTTNEKVQMPEKSLATEVNVTGSRHDQILRSHEEAGDNEDDDEDDEDVRLKKSTKLVMEQFATMQQQYSEGYSLTLTKLLQLASPSVHPIFNIPYAPQDHQQTPIDRSQSILVTHYADGKSLLPQCLGNPFVDAADVEDEYDSEVDYDEMRNQSRHEYQTSVNTESSSENESGSCRFANSDDEDDGSFRTAAKTTNLPWPDDHNEFLRSVIAQQSLCIEIASGYAADHEPTWIDSSRTIRTARGRLRSKKKARHPLRECDGPVLLPGSLRERGEFCILEIALVDQKTKQKQSSTLKPERRFAWEVQDVKFHRMI